MNILADFRAEAVQRGFPLAGVAPATDADSFALFDAWLAAGYAGEMAYLAKHREARRHPRAVLDRCQSVIMLGYDYAARSAERVPEQHGQVARYARGPDYHDRLRSKLNDLSQWLDAAVPGTVSRGVVDTAPLLERDFARRAGLGWIGKNTMLIHPRRGSFFFLAALLTTASLPPDEPFSKTHCGTCTACLDACPTNAFVAPGTLDATRCISYLTIEHRTAIPLELRTDIGDWLHGCDDCQTVCPWNRFAGPADDWPARDDFALLDCLEILTLDDAAFRARFRGTALFRDSRRGLVRNACIVLGNTGNSNALSALERIATESDAMLHDAATWAIERIQARKTTADAGD
jgi:epoxyqueuosine reductase